MCPIIIPPRRPESNLIFFYLRAPTVPSYSSVVVEIVEADKTRPIILPSGIASFSHFFTKEMESCIERGRKCRVEHGNKIKRTEKYYKKFRFLNTFCSFLLPKYGKFFGKIYPKTLPFESYYCTYMLLYALLLHI